MAKMTIDEAMKRIAELEAELAKLKELTPPGMSGYLVKTGNRQYSGETFGVQFRAGQAFIADGDNSEHIAGQMRDDFGYDVQRVEDWRQISKSETDQVRRSMIDVLQV